MAKSQPVPGDTMRGDDGIARVWENGEWRLLAALPAPSSVLDSLPKAMAVFDQYEIKLLPESEWGKADFQEYQDGYTYDQDGRGSCAHESVCGCAMDCLNQQTGEQVVFNPWVSYFLTNGYSDNGSSAPSNAKLGQEIGLCPMSVWDREKHGWTTLPPNDKDVMAPYKIGEVFLAETLQQLVTAMEHRIASCIGVIWQGGGGHEIRCTRWDRSGNRMEIKNSWGQWQGGGRKTTYGYLSRRQCEQGLEYFGAAVCIRSMTVSGGPK